MNDSDLLRPRALYEAIAHSLRERIFTHELAPGVALDEAALAQGYGVSRTPVREALKVLAHEGLVQLEPRRGCCVARLDTEDVDDLLAILDLLETHLLEVRTAPPAGDGRNRHAAEVISRLREKLRLACGPAFSDREAELLAAIRPAVDAALATHDTAGAKQHYCRFASARRKLAASMQSSLVAA
ncbi:hypothetical protein TMEC54S_01676 [Thauera mechernichensis]